MKRVKELLKTLLNGQSVVIEQNNRILENQYWLNERMRYIVALVKVDQTVLDAFGDTLDEIAEAVQTIIDDDSNDLGDADVSGITEPIARLQEILTKPAEPVDPVTPVGSDDEVSEPVESDEEVSEEESTPQ